MTIRSALLGVILASTLGLPATAQQIGTVASSEPTLRGTPPGAATRALGIGTALVAEERVASSASGRGQLLFLDQSTLSIAPNTTIVLDRFVFDPSGGGELGLSLTEGALRFIGGTLSRRGEATITTPAATIGIRGTTAIVVHLNGLTVAIFVAGDQLCLSVADRRSCTSRQGGVLTADGYQGRVNPAFLAQIIALIDGPAGAGPGPAPGIGIDRAGRPGSQPASPDGQRFDPDIFGDRAALDALLLAIPGLATPSDGIDLDGDGFLD